MLLFNSFRDALLAPALSIMPWDSSSRNVLVNSVSDIDLPTKSLTHGGGDYARDVVHQSQPVPVAGASGREIAERIKNRETQAIKENLEAIKDRTKFNEDLNKFLHDLKNQLKNKYLTLEQKNAIKKHIKHAKKQQVDNKKIINLLKKTI